MESNFCATTVLAKDGKVERDFPFAGSCIVYVGSSKVQAIEGPPCHPGKARKGRIKGVTSPAGPFGHIKIV